jgi:hypothetical protein
MTVPPWMEELSYAKCRFERISGKPGMAFEDLQKARKIVECQYQVLFDHRKKTNP